MQRERRGIAFIGLGLIITGGWYAISEVIIIDFGIERIWPIMLIFIGLALLRHRVDEQYAQGRVLLGSFFTLSGLVLLLFTLEIGNISWLTMGTYWPLFLIVIGGAFWAVYIYGGMEAYYLRLPVYVFITVGMTLLAITMGAFSNGVLLDMLRLWPLLIVVGASLYIYFRFKLAEQDEA